MELVSAIITTHNRANLLERAIKSVFGQTYKSIECIVIDDASTDNTKEICNRYPLQYVYIEKSKGGNYARNLGIKVAKGKYCAFLDDDDYWLPEKTEKEVCLIEQMDCEMVHCGRRMEYVYSNGVVYKNTLPKSDHWGDMHKKILLTNCLTTTSNILATRQALIDVGLFDENLNFWQDYELTIRLAQRKPIFFVNESLCVYRVDTRDKIRLTNKYDDWKKAARYVYDKHATLFNNLNWLEKELVRLNYAADASRRARSSNKLLCSAYYSLLVWSRFLPARIAVKIKGIL